MAQAEVLRVAVGFLDAIRRILAEARIHALSGDHELWPGGPMRHQHIHLFLVVLAEDAGLGRCGAPQGLRRFQTPPKLFGFAFRERLDKLGDRTRQNPRFGGARPDDVGGEARTMEFVDQPHVQGQCGHARRGRRAQAKGDAQQEFERGEVGPVDEPAVVSDPWRCGRLRSAVDDGVEQKPSA